MVSTGGTRTQTCLPPADQTFEVFADMVQDDLGQYINGNRKHATLVISIFFRLFRLLGKISDSLHQVNGYSSFVETGNVGTNGFTPFKCVDGRNNSASTQRRSPYSHFTVACYIVHKRQYSFHLQLLIIVDERPTVTPLTELSKDIRPPPSSFMMRGKKPLISKINQQK